MTGCGRQGHITRLIMDNATYLQPRTSIILNYTRGRDYHPVVTGNYILMNVSCAPGDLFRLFALVLLSVQFGLVYWSDSLVVLLSTNVFLYSLRKYRKPSAAPWW